MADLGLLISILHSAEDAIWSNVAHTLHVLQPRWSSIAIDLWSRPNNSSAATLRLALLQRRASVLALFSRVLFLETAPRLDVPSHVRPSFSYRLHWHAAFADPVTHLQTRGQHSEGLPTLLAGIDADHYVPKRLPLERIVQVLEGVELTSSDAAERAEALARRAWLHGRVPHCGRQTALSSRRQALQPAAGRAVDANGGIDATPSMCEVISAAHRPLWVSPRDLAALEVEQRTSFAELGMYFYPLRLGNCCGRQNMPAPRRMQRATGANVAILSRGPYCPPSTFFVVHRQQLGRLLGSFQLWREAYEARALTRDKKRLRWEYVSCALLAPGEAGLLLYYNHTQLDLAGLPADSA